MLWQVLIVFFSGFITYGYLIWKGGFVIDDVDSILAYDGKLQGKGYYDILKHIWYLACGKNPHHHHFLNILFHSSSATLLYLFLGPIIGYDISFLASLLFCVHPLGNQVAGWISGKGYSLGLMFLLVALNLIHLTYLPIIKYALFALSLVIAIMGQFATMCSAPIIFFLGEKALSIVALIISTIMGLNIVRTVIGERQKTFKKQNMGNSTYVKPQKIIVAIKTLAYYTLLCLFPVKLGIYHKWGYHYDEKIEKEDGMFWLGCLILLGLAGMFYFGSLAIKFGVLWYLSFIFIFLNWITIHQFVSERYAYIANIGLCICIADILIGYPVVAGVIIGVYLARTWAIIPSYNDLIRFYISNIWNFETSEVAMANLGVVLMRNGLVGMAVDYWLMADKLNPDYDVPAYNLYSTYKQRGEYTKARDYLVKAINSKTCHFKKGWKKELESFDKELIMNKCSIHPSQYPKELLTKVVNNKNKIVDISIKPTNIRYKKHTIIERDIKTINNKGELENITIKENVQVKEPEPEVKTIRVMGIDGKMVDIPVAVPREQVLPKRIEDKTLLSFDKDGNPIEIKIKDNPTDNSIDNQGEAPNVIPKT